MDLMERYLAAIRRELPAARADDILAELRDDLLSRIEAREEALGRALDKAETAALLEDFGRPMLVAAKYREHQHLIGPEVFPYYRAALRAVLTVVAIVMAVLAGVDLAFGTRDLWQALGRAGDGIVGTALTAFAIVTLIFAFAERRGWCRGAADWKVDQLPSLDELATEPRRDAPVEIVAGGLFLLWWFGAIPFPPFNRSEFTIVGAPVWAGLFWPIALLLAARLVMSVLALTRRLAPLRQALAVITTIAGLVLVVLLFRAGHWVDVLPGTASAEQADGIETSLNLAIRIALVVCAIVWTLGAVGGLWRWWRRRQSRAIA